MISAKNLGKTFDGSWLFQDVSFDVSLGKSMAIIGPSGSGKSVLLKIIAGLVAADEGSYALGSARIGMLFQRNALFDSLTAEENLLFPLREALGITGVAAREKAHAMLEAVGLSDAAGLFPDELSGGMQKRLGIARALVIEPEIILYDEPTAGLDPVTSRRIADMIGCLQRERNSTLVVVTNDIRRACQLGHSIHLLARGRLTAGDTATGLMSTADPAIRQFISGLREGPLT